MKYVKYVVCSIVCAIFFEAEACNCRCKVRCKTKLCVCDDFLRNFVQVLRIVTFLKTFLVHYRCFVHLSVCVCVCVCVKNLMCIRKFLHVT